MAGDTSNTFLVVLRRDKIRDPLLFNASFPHFHSFLAQ